MMDVMEFDMGPGGNRGRPPPRIASRLAAGSRSGEAKSTEGRARARPPPGRADSKASDPGTMLAKRPGSITTDPIQQARGRDSRTVHRRGSSDDEAAAKPMSRRVPGYPPGYTMRASGTERRGNLDREASATTDERPFRLGQKIEGRHHGKGRWYKGRIIGTNPDGTYDVRYENGDEDLRLNASAIKSVDGVETSRKDSDSRHRTGGAHLPRIGDRVEAKAPGSAGWRAATVVGENRDGSLDVQFRDGTKEKRLEPSLVRVPRQEHGGSGSGSKSKSGAGSFRVGDDIEARYRGKSRWFRGVVRRVNSDQTYDIRYADGDEETGVDSSLIRLLDVYGGAGGTSGSTIEDYRVGDKVEARFGGRARWFPAKIERENRDGTFSLLYDDGDVERAVDKSLMRHVGGGSGAQSWGAKSPRRRVVSGVSSDAVNDFREGDKVQARYKRGRKWSTGVIRAVGRDGTYDIRYDDGDTEGEVDPGMVKSIGAGSVDSLSRTAVAKRGEGEFSAGDKVEALYGGRSQWFKATVERRNRDGTYHLIYASGEEERAVGKDMIRTLDELPPRRGDTKSTNHRSPSRNDDHEPDAGPSRKLRVGDEIEARYRRGNKWFPGVIRSANRDGTYDVRYKDGDQERDIEPLFIRAKASTRIDSLASSEGGFSKGDKVEARFQGRSRWFKATVERDNRDGTFHLLYQDGDEETAVSRDLIRRHFDGDSQEDTKAGKRKVANCSKMGGNDSESDVNRYRIGVEIEARYKRGRKWYPGEIRATNRDGTYDIRYKDGDTENDVDAALIRRKDRGSLESLTASTINGEQSEFAEGEQVEARLGGKARWLKATVERRNRDGTYYIVYMNGEEERVVEKTLIRRLSSDRDSERPSSSSVSRRAASPRGGLDANSPAKKSICAGDEIESRYKGRREWYPGVVRAVNRDGTYDVQYKDGDIEYDVIPSFVRVASTISLTSNDAADVKNEGVEYVEGDKVEARFRGRSRWFKARVSKVNRDGTYHLVYDDGDEERSVPKGLMRQLGRDTAGDRKDDHRSDATQDAPNEPKKHRVGDEIEARYKRGHKWYTGIILAVNTDGTCDIRYSDGDSERDVEPTFIRNKVISNATSSDSISDDFVEGDEVEARFGGRSRWFKATVERKNRDKTYYLRYADGDVERSVEKHLIRRVTSVGLSRIKSPGRHVVSGAESDPDSSAPRSYRVGDDVEARYKRGQKWYPGVVRSVNRDGTYDIRYNDGDNEQDVVSRMIRGVRASRDTVSSATSLLDVAPADGRTENFAVGEKVEARFGGRSRWFEATVERKNRDGTYHLLYNDGDKERNVERDLIRRVDAGGCRRSEDGLTGHQTKSITEVDRAGESAGEDLREGDEIEARYRQGRKWYPGVICTVNRDGTYKIRYNDGDVEHSVQRASIREKSVGRVDRPASPRKLARDSNSFVAGDEVEARLGGRARWLKATVERKNRDGTYHLLYSNGEEERMVEKVFIRRVDRRGNPKADAGNSKREDSDRITCERVNSVDSIISNGAGYRVGDKVEARFRGGSRWFKGTIDGENPDGTFMLLYADGDKERAVHASLIRRLARNGDEAKAAIGDSSDSVFRVGDAIEARYKRGTRWYPGVIRKANIDGTFDIRYKDGDAESSVPVELIRSAVSSSATTSTAPNEASSFSTGERVEARYGGGSGWLKATVERKNRNGTYHLVYDNGGLEKSVERDLVRKIDKGGKDSDARSFTRRMSSRGAGSETDHEAEEVVRVSHQSRSPSKRREGLRLPSVGDRVEARFRGGRAWMAGRVSRVRRDGSYDITYRNGDREGRVPEDHVRLAGPIEGSTDSDSNSDHGATNKSRHGTIMEGDRVEVRLDGEKTWEKATVTRVHSDGTYDVCWRNGEQHKRVSPRRVRRLGDAPSRDNPIPSRHGSEGSIRSEMDDSRGNARGRSRGRKNEHQDRVRETANAAATRVLRALRKAGKTVDELKRKLERVDRGKGIDREALEPVLAGFGAVIPPREARDLYRSCVDVDNDDCIDLSSLISLLHRERRHKRAGSSARRRSSSSRLQHHHSSSSSTSDVSVGAQRRLRAASRSQGRDRSSRHGSQADLRTDHTPRSRRRSSSARRGKRLRSRTGTTSESDESGSISSSDRSKDQDGGQLLSKRGLIGLRKLEAPAFDGSLRHEFEKLSGGRGRDLPTSKLKRLLRQLRVKIDATVFHELVTILDSEEIGSVSLGGLLEAALSTSEDKKVAKIHADISKQLFKPDARGSKHQNSKKAKALSASITKALVKMEQPKNSGLVLTSSLKKLLQKVGASAPSVDVQTLGERLDPDYRGKIDREALVLWLTTGFDLHQAESRASRQLSLLESTIPQLERVFREFDVHREGMVTKIHFISAIRRLGLVLTHGQTVALATEHHKDYESFIADSSKLGKKRSSSSVEESSDNSDGESTDRPSRARSKVDVSGRGTYGGSSDDSDRGDMSGPNRGEERGKEANGVLLGKTARMALRDIFERSCSSTGGVREVFYSAGKGSGDEDRNGQGLTSREQTQHFFRRLKLDLNKDDRIALVEALTGPQDDQPGKRKRKRRSSRGETDDENGNVGGVRVPYRDFLELLLAEQESKEVARVFGRMWKDLEKIADTKRTCPFTFVAKIMSRHEGEGTTGFVKASDFKRGLEKMGIGEVSSKEKSLLVRRFDPNEEGMINYELFAAWLSCGIDEDRLEGKMGRLLGQLTGRQSRGGKGRQEKEVEGKRTKRLPKGGVRAVFKTIDQDAEGTVTQHDMRVVLQEKLGLPLTEGDFKALFRRLDKDSDGMLDYEELFVLASTKKRDGDRGKDGDDNNGRSGLFSKLKRRGSTLVKGAADHITKHHGRDMTTDDAPSNDNSETGTEAEDDEDRGEMRDADKARDKKKRRQNDKDKTKDKKKQNNNKDDGRRSGRGTTTRTSKRERSAKLARIRVSILRQTAVVAKEKPGDGKQCNEENGTHSNVKVDWLAMFERRDRAGSGKAKIQDLEAVLEEAGAHLSGEEMARLLSRFEAPTVCHGDGTMSDGGNRGGKDEDSAVYMDYEAFVVWLSEGGLDDAVLLKVKRHIKGRLNKTKDLRTLFSEMCGSTKEQLSASRLAKGLRHAGLPLDRAVVDQLLEAFSSRGVRGRRLSYTEFHRMVHCDGLRSGGLETMDAEGNNSGSAGRARDLDEEIRSTLLETIKQAFAFYDEDDSNSIETADLINILRAMGHEPTRKERRALLRDADADRNGVIQYEDFQEAVMPFLLQRTQSKRLTEGEMRAIFDEIDKDGSGLVTSEDFAYLFSRKLRLLSQHEVETLLALLDRHQSGQVSWEEFAGLFELIDDHVGDGEAEALNPNVKEVATVALRKLQMGCMPDVKEQLCSFSGMPTTYRKSVLAPLDQIKELSLQWVLMPKLDSHGCLKLQDMSVKVTTEVAEVEAPKVPLDDSRKILVKTTNISDSAKSGKHNKKTPPRTLAATLGFGKREISPPPATVSTSKEINTQRKSSILEMGLRETTTTVTKRAELQEVGAPTDEGMRGWNGHEQDPSGVMQVELSVKQAYGIPVPKDSRASDIRQRGMRACLFYDASGDVDRDAGEATSEYGEHFLCNTYKTLAIQHPQKEEQWLFPDSAEGERKFLVRTDFGRRVGRDQGGQKVRSHASGSKDRLFLLVELTCTVQTVKDRDAREDEDEGYARGGYLAGGGGAIRGPLKNFRTSSSRTRGRKSRWGRKRDVGSESSYENSSGKDDEPYRHGIHKDRNRDGESDTVSESDSAGGKRSRSNERGRRKRQIEYSNDYDESADTATDSDSDGETAGKRKGTRAGHNSRRRGGQITARGCRGRASRGQRKSERKAMSASPFKHGHGRTGASTYMSQNRRGVHSEGPRHRKCRGQRGAFGSGGSGYETNSDELSGISLGDSDSLSLRDIPRRRRERQGGWRGPWRGLKGVGRWKSSSERRTEDVVEVEMSCGWVLIPFLDLVETPEIRRVRYNLSGGTPFAKANINEDEVMTRRYGWRALLKALKIQDTHKESEIEIKILPVTTLRTVKQEDIFRLPRNIVLSDTFVSLVRYYREYAANSLARRSAKGMGNAGFGAVLGLSEPVLALFPRLVADPALMMALKNQWDVEVRKSHVDGILGTTVSTGLANIGIGSSGGLTGATGATRGAVLTTAFEKAVLKLWPAYCHIDAQRRGGEGIRAESYEELEARSQKIRQILSKSDSFRSDTPMNVFHGGDRAMFRMPGRVGAFLTPDAHESGIMVAFKLKEVVFDIA